MNYIELKLTVNQEFADIFVAELGEIGFDTFTDEADGINAYCTEELFLEESVKEIIERYAEMTEVSYTLQKMEKQNWNAEWERNYDPIAVHKQVRVRASFHEPDSSFEHEIVIDPKMSFGTGHHETTWMVLHLQHQLKAEHKNAKVLDVGSGTGILAIYASKLGASEISAFDIEEWATENARENVMVNACENISVRQGTIEDEPAKMYDIILANINRNILMRDIPKYTTFMKPNAFLVVSGFYEKDIEDIQEVAQENRLSFIQQEKRNDWTAVIFQLTNGNF
jgi:ribosomal protein L11 methyltransferase